MALERIPHFDMWINPGKINYVELRNPDGGQGREIVIDLVTQETLKKRFSANEADDVARNIVEWVNKNTKKVSQ